MEAINFVSLYKNDFGNIVIKIRNEHLVELNFCFEDYELLESEEWDLNFEKSNKIKRWLDEYFEGKIPKVKFKHNFDCQKFQRTVWEATRDIPYGTTWSYKELSEYIFEKKKVMIHPRNLGKILSENPILIIFPCHRVIASGGDLSGYSSGIEIKEKLIKFEASNLDKFN